MSHPSVLVLAEDYDPMGPHLVAALEQRGCQVSTLDASAFPSGFQLSFNKPARAAGRANASHALLCPDAIVYRQSKLARAPFEMRSDIARYVSAECNRFLADVWACLDAVWFPAAPDTIRAAQNKLRQLQLAAELGLTTPPTLVTNDPAAARAFWNEHGGQLVTKMPSELFQLVLGDELARYTEQVSSAHVHGAQLAAVRCCPTLFQKQVEKRRELRVTVVDDAVFVAFIYSQSTRRTRIDWRRYNHGATRYETGALPAEIARACITMTARLGLRHAAIDMIETPAGELVFLEINPGGQWGWIEAACSLPITDALVDAIAATPRRSSHGN